MSLQENRVYFLEQALMHYVTRYGQSDSVAPLIAKGMAVETCALASPGPKSLELTTALGHWHDTVDEDMADATIALAARLIEHAAFELAATEGARMAGNLISIAALMSETTQKKRVA